MFYKLGAVLIRYHRSELVEETEIVQSVWVMDMAIPVPQVGDCIVTSGGETRKGGKDIFVKGVVTRRVFLRRAQNTWAMHLHVQEDQSIPVEY